VSSETPPAEPAVPAEQEQVQPPPGQLGLNPTNQFQSDPTPTAGPDRSVPDAPVVGGGEREPMPGEDGPQATARRLGGAWPPLAAEGAAKGTAKK